jgi:hypothetical protein
VFAAMALGGLINKGNNRSGNSFAAMFLLFHRSQTSRKALPPLGNIGEKRSRMQQ